MEAAPGANTYTAYSYEGRRDAFALALDYEGQTDVDGVYALPALGFDFASSPYEVLERHAAALVRHGCALAPAQRLQPAWWREPIFCGWGAQCGVAAAERGSAPDHCAPAHPGAYPQPPRTAGAPHARGVHGTR